MSRNQAPLGEIGQSSIAQHVSKANGSAKQQQQFCWDENDNTSENVRHENAENNSNGGNNVLRKQTARKAVRGGKISNGVGRRASVSSASSVSVASSVASPKAMAAASAAAHSLNGVSGESKAKSQRATREAIESPLEELNPLRSTNKEDEAGVAEGLDHPHLRDIERKHDDDTVEENEPLAFQRAKRDMGIATARVKPEPEQELQTLVAEPRKRTSTATKASPRLEELKTTAEALGTDAHGAPKIVSAASTSESDATKTGSTWRIIGLLTLAALFGALISMIVTPRVVEQMKPSPTIPFVSSKSFFHSVSIGEPFEFELDVSNGSPPLKFQWRLNGVNVAGATDSILRVPSVTLRDSGTYSCVVENEAGRVLWEEGYLNVIEGQESRFSSDASSQDAHSEEDSSAFPSSIPMLASSAEPPLMLVPSLLELEAQAKRGDSTHVRQVRTCLLRQAPDEIMRAASIDGGAAVIAAGYRTDFLQCFPSLAQTLQQGRSDKELARQQDQAIDMLRSLHGTSKKRSLLVNVVAAVDDLAKAKIAAQQDSTLLRYFDDLISRVAFQAGLYCASTPRCASTASDRTGLDARTRFINLVLSALTHA
mmetsp:Transcript_14136/g.27462  ORF Transcript_14136/g.27462 Transcript_14136/m.27462 type:complete len:598 (-) Transcript_14136:480-2273(-)|eukprot:CAMPEP_0171492638 /NCGR_PEP_ID=MMETSP0958-20121227/4519_1 /TAXON_ID=87120 /ORGANISM="Aurantiochytrium limacinum, Strain ATCCMYA-1381" /LENGTH=597 /DNA_ID=CAMNT_0012026175 /DNA_START=534 /DNA_END=2327 /DNA_ORIENTATION=-